MPWWLALGIFSSTLSVIALVIFVILWGIKFLGWNFKVYGEMFFDFHKWITYTIPNRRSGREQIMKEEIERQEALKLASQERLRLLSKQDHNKVMVGAALNRANFLQNKYPYASYDLIDEYIVNFSKYSMQQLEKIEEKIKVSHIQNLSINSDDIGKRYTLSDLTGHRPINTKSEYPFELRLFSLGLDYVLHIRNTMDDSDTLLQSKDREYMFGYLLNIEDKFKLLKIRNKRIISNKDMTG